MKGTTNGQKPGAKDFDSQLSPGDGTPGRSGNPLLGRRGTVNFYKALVLEKQKMQNKGDGHRGSNVGDSYRQSESGFGEVGRSRDKRDG